MPYLHWREAVASLKPLLKKSTDSQGALARAVGGTLPKSLPWLVAGARLQALLAEQLATDGLQPPTDSVRSVIYDLSDEVGARVPEPGSRIEADAWIRYLYLKKRVRTLEALKPVAGDTVRSIWDDEEDVREISSIGNDGRLHFRGRRGRAWPDRVVKVAEASDTSPRADELRRRARNLAAAADVDRPWSLAKMNALAEYEAPNDLEWHELNELREVIESASTERPVQEFLQSRPQILASLVRGPIRYVIPKAPMGVSYVTDFLVADVDSIGIRWLLLELETPRSGIALKTKNEYDESARQGVSQVREWREYLQDNLANAHLLRSQGGLGLFDIRPQSDGLVIVGRRELLKPRARQIRAQTYEMERISVHTYDWLLERLEGILNFQGTPGANPYLIHRPSSLEWAESFFQ